MASNAQTIAITRALLALSTAVIEMQRALLVEAPLGNETVTQHLKTAGAAIDESLEHIQRLVALFNGDHG